VLASASSRVLRSSNAAEALVNGTSIRYKKLSMGRTIGGITAVIALAVVAFCAAYFGGGALTKAPAAQATSGGAALRAPGIALNGAPVAMRTPTATPSPTATPKPKKKKHTVKHKKAKKQAATTVKRRYTPQATPVPTRVATAVPTRAPVYHPPAVKTAKPRPQRTPGVIIED
jgi:hypothetical protein